MKELGFKEKREAWLVDFLLQTTHTCGVCPMAVDRELGRNRLVCRHKDKVVLSHHAPSTDCVNGQGQNVWEVSNAS
jgi:hypothetical protein